MTAKINRNKEFIINTIILFAGKFSTQFMSLLLLPLFTRYLLTEDYGAVDLLQTYISLFIPILTLRIDSALFRFLIDKRNDEVEKCNIVSNAIVIMSVSIIVTIIISIPIILFLNIRFIIYTIINLIILMISNILLQLLRGLGKNKEYSLASIITGAVTLISNLVLIIGCHVGAESILISSSLGNILCIVYITVSSKLFKYIKLDNVNKCTTKEILKYSLPMIPNYLSWWIVNISDRTIISTFLGTAFNGIYTVSCKFSNILNSVFSIFSMSWQETASLHINDNDKDYFFSKVINEIFFLFSNIALIILAVLPVFYDILIGANYLDSYNYIPILLYANSWNVLIGLIGGIYVAKKQSRAIANTTMASAVINILINLMLVKFVGLYAASISTLLSYLIMSIYRYFDCKKYVNIKIDFKTFSVFSIVFVISSLLYYSNNIYLNLVNLLFVIIYSLIINKKYIFKAINFFKIKIIKRL